MIDFSAFLISFLFLMGCLINLFICHLETKYCEELSKANLQNVYVSSNTCTSSGSCQYKINNNIQDNDEIVK